ncbi:crossover junction endodeoxyribonuclease RuvC [Mucisphaera calidilacus]|uniref:Crossover junction endodeoxyribonuclease RuvC n=1 Tax=Mucisphaera calidilacus TaxID=2527982 RepID=A0A518BTB1_9BACT|nr:crossover junction endodeoxyribonuclease RuvC [Mucisphaera calidilacus]QDU70212.1 Crossover junction endodeoxyribonuclease RuvC [Mucisphaera calidilacus]
MPADTTLATPPSVLGIDPGSRVTGYALLAPSARPTEPRVIEAGIIKLNPAHSLDHRIHQLHADLTELIQRLGPHVLAIEKLYAHYAHPQTAIVMAHARGVILLAARQTALTLEHLPSTEVKKSVTGHGHASKEQVQQAVTTQLGLAEPPEPADVSDALAIALTSFRRRTLASL